MDSFENIQKQKMMQILFEKWAGEPCVDVQPLSAHGSNRKYYRLKGETKHCLAAVNDDVRENEAFFIILNISNKRV